MYYEEKWVDGTLCFRTMPDGPWHSFTINMLLERVLSQEEEIKAMRQVQSKLVERICKIKEIAEMEVGI